MADKLFTYTTTQDKLKKHPDQTVVKRLKEVSKSGGEDCTAGTDEACVILQDPKTTLRLLVHRCRS